MGVPGTENESQDTAHGLTVDRDTLKGTRSTSYTTLDCPSPHSPVWLGHPVEAPRCLPRIDHVSTKEGRDQIERWVGGLGGGCLVVSVSALHAQRWQPVGRIVGVRFAQLEDEW